MKPEQQLAEWVKGNPIHNKERNECCPDFSCCNKRMNTPKHVRERFVTAVRDDDEKTQMTLLGSFLSQAALSMGKRVYVAGKLD